MNHYLFFDADFGERFLEFARSLGLEGEGQPDSIAGYVIALPEDLDDEMQARIEAHYDELMEAQQRFVEAQDETARTLMAVWIELPGGERRAVQLPARWARRLYEHFRPEEVNEIVAEIARGVLNPVDGPLCKR